VGRWVLEEESIQAERGAVSGLKGVGVPLISPPPNQMTDGSLNFCKRNLKLPSLASLKTFVIPPLINYFLR
jgi:hypothetical protein